MSIASNQSHQGIVSNEQQLECHGRVNRKRNKIQLKNQKQKNPLNYKESLSKKDDRLE